MQLSVDQKIQLAVQPLIQRITALEAENEKFKQEIAALHIATQPKTAHKPAPKPPVQVERPQTVKGGRKKSVQNHEVKPETKTDKKPVIKKQEPKVDGEEIKTENPKHPGTKTPVIGGKGVGSPNLTKDQNAVNKDIKPKPTTGTGNRVSHTNLNNKSIIGEKKGTNKPIEHNEQKKEGEQHHEEKKENASHEKIENGKPAHTPKTPAIAKKPVQIKKAGPAPALVTTAKKTGKQPIKDPKQKVVDPKAESLKVEVKQETKDEVKQELKEETKQEHTDATKQEVKAEQEVLLHEEQNSGVEQAEQKQEIAPQDHVEQNKQHDEQEAL